MTPDELRALRSAATSNWRQGERYPESLSVWPVGDAYFHTRMASVHDARLAALAPALATLAADMAEALAWLLDEDPLYELDESPIVTLARFSAESAA